MDNFQIKVVSEGDLRPVMQVACRNDKATGFRVDLKDGDPRLTFFKYAYKENGVVQFPFAMDCDGMADFARRWLAEANYGKQPDHDGDNGKGWCVYTDIWGMVDGCHSAFVAVRPVWACYGK